jgi:hypothetical protein
MKKVNTLNIITKVRQYQKKLKWLKDHGELIGEDGQNAGEESYGNKSLSN